MALTRRKFVLFAAAAVMLSVLLTLVVALAADLYLHQRAEKSAGLNRWGYRGPVAGRKQAGELRVVMLGGSTAFGYGVTWDEAIPARLERELNASGGAPFSVVNLGFNNEGVYSFLPTLQDYESLDYDLVVLYEGYNDLFGDQAPNLAVYRHESVVFRLTGYFPILPLALNEKALALRHGSLDAAYAAIRREPGATTVFRPGLASRTSATALEAAESVSNALGRQLGRFAAQPSAAPHASEAGCATPWSHYCDSVFAAARHAAERGKAVAIVGQPLLASDGREPHRLQQQALADMVRRKFAGSPRVRYVDLTGTVNLADSTIAFDGMHLNAGGNAMVARALAPAVRELTTAVGTAASR
ncbi:MAG: GDSL-type esterase/lipase family protein [Vicinamibacterales bacterium]